MSHFGDVNNDPALNLFAIRGSLDGEIEQDFAEREQFIGCKVNDEEFYLSIGTVIEILMLQPITFVPNAPEYIEGVLNLRGRIVPAINLRKMMGQPRGKVTPATRVVIVRFEQMMVGLLVDAITYVVALAAKEIEDQTLPGGSQGAELITRISKHDEKISGILDVGKIITIAAGGKLVLSELMNQDQEAS